MGSHAEWGGSGPGGSGGLGGGGSVGGVPQRYLIAVATLSGGPDRSIAGSGGAWPVAADCLKDVFVHHPDSVRNYWRRATFGMANPVFDVFPTILRLDHRHAQSQGGGGRNRVLDAARRKLEAIDAQALRGYDHLVVVAPPYPTDAGATGGDVAFDQGPGTTLAFLQHEVGHTLGFQHAFGPYVPNEFDHLYNDPFCVMGYTGTNSRLATGQNWAAFFRAGPDLWRTDRRPSAAALIRRYDNFALSGRVTNVSGRPNGNRVQLYGLCSISHPETKVQAAVLQRPGGGAHERLVVEYRPAVGDDAGVPPSVVIHSIGCHPVGPGRSEQNPPWFEGRIDPVSGQSLNVAGVAFTVANVSAGAPAYVDVVIDMAPPPPLQEGWRWCRRCQCLAYAGNGTGVCWDGNPHDHGPSGSYGTLLGSGVLPPVQPGWRWCRRCQCLAYAGGGPGICHDGKPHDHSGSGRYRVAHGSDPWPGQQGSWRWCKRCQCLAYAGSGTGVCWDGNPHDHSGSGKYSLNINV